jgi:branched-chain amino acid transport system ATP-binding protein
MAADGPATPLLQVEHLDAGFGNVQVLWDVTLAVNAGELIALIGANGAGKSTLLGTISRLVPARAGRIVFAGHDISAARPHQVVRWGLIHVPQGRRLFGNLTVEMNLRLGAFSRPAVDGLDQDLERVLTTFPVLRQKMKQEAGRLSGGEQQMCAIARGLMGRPRLLMIDELSLGLAPKAVDRVIEAVKTIDRQQTSILMVEQDVLVALETADRGYVLETGRVVLSGQARDLLADPNVRSAYLGI